MKHFYLTILTFLLISNSSFAQESSRPSVESEQLTYHLLFGISYEGAVGRLNTLRVSGPLDAGFLIESTTINGYTHTESGYYLRIGVTGEFRHYYNLDKRLSKGKRVDKNSGNFIAPVVTIMGPALAHSDNVEVANFATAVGGVWGIQRNYGKRFNFQLSIGPGVGFADGEISFVPMGGLSLGFRLGK